MSNFEAAPQIVMKHEGGYANNPNDRGGETYKAVARKRHPNWPGWKIVDANKSISNFPANLVTNGSLQLLVFSFYKAQFWDALCLGQINDQQVALELYDTAVNMGPGIAGLFLQTALNVSNRNERDYPDLIKDGVIGPKSVAYMNRHKRPGDILKVLNVL